MDIRHHLNWRGQYSLIILVVTCVVGIGLRTVHHDDWLVFQSDQSRDALIINAAMENGPGTLPLVGPQARGSSLHLGPLFYYFQYFSAKIFGQSPESLAYPDLLFGILTLPLLFFLLRRFISLPLSLTLTAFASTSILLVTFSRFAWNPNSLPFFTTAFILSFLSALESGGRKRWFLLAGASASLGIIANLHFVPTIGLTSSLLVFLILTRSLKWKEILFCASLVALFQLPTLIYEVRSNGATLQALIKTVEEKSSQDDSHNLLEKIFRAYQEESRIVWLLTTGQQNTDMILTRGFLLKCDKKCDAALPYSLLAMALTAMVTYMSFIFYRNTTETKKQRELLFLFLCFASFFITTVPLAYQISTRFYLGVAPLLFVFFGLSLTYLVNLSKKSHFKLLFYGMGIVLLGLNIAVTTTYLSELALSRVSAEESGTDLVFGTESKVTLDQLRALAAATQERFRTSDPLFISGESRYARSLYYILSVEYGFSGCYLKGSVDEPVSVNHVRVIKNKPELVKESLSREKERVPFGTLALKFMPANSSAQKNSLPKECLTY